MVSTSETICVDSPVHEGIFFEIILEAELWISLKPAFLKWMQFSEFMPLPGSMVSLFLANLLIYFITICKIENDKKIFEYPITTSQDAIRQN